MEFAYTEDQLMILDELKRFAKEKVEPIAAECDRDSRFPMENISQLAEMGMLGIVVDEKYGGAGMDMITYCLAVEELSKTCASTGGILAAINSLVNYPLEAFGTEEQKQKYLHAVATGEKLGCFALTEPNAGSDALGIKTTAVLEGDYYILNGTKQFISGGDVADICICFAKVKGRGAAFIVEKGMEGYSVGKHEDKLGIRASTTTELIFENCKVPKENLLGKVGKGLKIAMETLDCGRISVAAQALGIAQGALEAAVKYIMERKQFDQPIGKFQGIQFMVADMATRVEAARLLVHKAAWQKDQGQKFAKASAMAKLYAAETAMWVTTKALQLHGGYGYTKDYPIERMFRDAKITEIYEGTSEIQRLVIASAVIKELM